MKNRECEKEGTEMERRLRALRAGDGRGQRQALEVDGRHQGVVAGHSRQDDCKDCDFRSMGRGSPAKEEVPLKPICHRALVLWARSVVSWWRKTMETSSG